MRILLARLSFALWQDDLAYNALRAEEIDKLDGVAFHACRIAAMYLQRHRWHLAKHYATLAIEALPCLTRSRRLMLEALVARGYGDLDAALACYNRWSVEGLDSQTQSDCLGFLAQEFSNAGRQEARALFLQQLAIDPTLGVPYLELIQLEGLSELSHPLVVAASSLLADRCVAGESRYALHVAMSKVHERRGDYARAFVHTTLGNQVIARHLPPRTEKDYDLFTQRTRQVFTKDLIESLRAFGSTDRCLICIVGMPRSGTSLLHQILSEFPECHGVGELADFSILVSSLQAITQSRLPYPECCRRLPAALVSQLATTVQRRLTTEEIAPGKRLVTKLPEDWWYLGFISILFPNVQIIHCRRNAVDTCLSCYQSHFAANEYARDLNSLHCVYQQYCALLRHWSQVLPTTSLFEVDYESLVEQPESQLEELCTFLGFSFNCGCLEFYKRHRPIRTVSRWQVRHPIHVRSIKRSADYREFLGPLVGLSAPTIRPDIRG